MEIDAYAPDPQFTANEAGVDYLEILSSNCQCLACQFLQQLCHDIKLREERESH